MTQPFKVCHRNVLETGVLNARPFRDVAPRIRIPTLIRGKNEAGSATFFERILRSQSIGDLIGPLNATQK